MKSIYEENGYTSRKEYLKYLSEEYGVGLSRVYAIATLYGPSEDFDGLVAALNDYEFD